MLPGLWRANQRVVCVIRAIAAAIRAEIGQRLKRYYNVSQTVPDRFAPLLDKIERSNSRSVLVGQRGFPASKQDEYLNNADECERLAEMAQDPKERTSWLQMAQQWHRWAKRK
jgi:Anti-sigma factor NepR